MTELIFSICGKCYRALLQDGFLSPTTTARLHKHNYAEIHIVSGDMTVEVGGELITLKANDALAIPEGSYHRILPADGTRRISFQTDAPLDSLRSVNLTGGVASMLIDEAASAQSSGNFSLTAAYIAVAVSALSGMQYPGENLPDYSLMIREFFSRRYGEDVRLSHLAEELHLSERQTERLVLLYTGKCFRDELTATRMAVADQLISEGRMPLGEIASYVGYRSYAGFFKARKPRK